MKSAYGKKKLKLLIRRIVWLGILIASVVICIVSFNDDYDDGIAYIMFVVSIFVLLFFISTLLQSYKAYTYNGKIIEVYSGWYHHYMTYGGIKVDEHNTIQTYAPIWLSCTLDDGTFISAVISTSGRIALKINDRLYTKKARHVK